MSLAISRIFFFFFCVLFFCVCSRTIRCPCIRSQHTKKKTDTRTKSLLLVLFPCVFEMRDAVADIFQRVIKQMFEARGYDGGAVRIKTDSDLKRVRFELVSKDADGRPVVCLVMSTQDNIGTKDVEVFLEPLERKTHLVLVGGSISSQARTLLSAAADKSWEFLHFREVSFNLLENVYVPSYRLLRPEEVRRVEARFGSSRMFPAMVANVDPVARFMNFQPGDVLKVVENSTVSGKNTFFCRVIAEEDQL